MSIDTTTNDCYVQLATAYHLADYLYETVPACARKDTGGLIDVERPLLVLSGARLPTFRARGRFVLAVRSVAGGVVSYPRCIFFCTGFFLRTFSNSQWREQRERI